MNPENFQKALLDWFDCHGRKDLPWQKNISPYKVWVSEIMLQQTQVATVIPYFEQFMEKFPTIEALAKADLDEVLHSWSGLGYYARARNLHKSACLMSDQAFPDTLEGLMQMPGIGLSTAGAILSIACQQSHAILDGNVKRVLTRFRAIEGWPGQSRISKLLWEISKQYTPVVRVADYTQAIMDLGATICTRKKPNCTTCPIRSGCKARQLNRINDFPTPKPTKAMPVKKCTVLFLINSENEILLEQRPPTGIWGGLWSLPEFSDVQTACLWCQDKNIQTDKLQTLSPGRHTFSHYHLDYSVLSIMTRNPMNNVMETNQSVWYKAQNKYKIGLPAPIKKLIQQQILTIEETNG
jgi:A/G-specific adenine glycosylase